MKNYDFPLETAQNLIVLNGERSDMSVPFQHIHHETHLIIADGAWNDVSSILPTNVGEENIVVMGDGDSIHQRPPAFIETADQDFTDFEKIIRCCIKKNMTSADVYWASGGEMDHFLGNLSVAAKYHNDIELRFFDATHCYVYAEHDTLITGAVGKKMSIYPFPRCHASSRGLAYELSDAHLTQQQQQSLRNVITSDAAEVTIVGGAFLFIEQ